MDPDLVNSTSSTPVSAADPLEGAETDRSVLRCERGSVSVLVLFMGLVIYALAALVWNTGEVTAAKMEAQTAADSAAYSTAVWTSRAVNVIAATNMLALRDASAMGVAVAMQFEMIWIPVWLAVYYVSTIVPLWAGLITIPLAVAQTALWTAQLILYLTMMIEVGGPITPLLDAIEAGQHLVELREYQEAWVDAVPQLIEEQRRQLEDYFDCDITLVQGNGSTAVEAPLRRGDGLSAIIPIGLRYAYDAFADESWFSDVRLPLIWMGYAKYGYYIGAGLGAAVAIPMIGSNHHVLSSQPPWSPLEVGPAGWGFVADPVTWRDYSVVAVARKRTSNARSQQLPEAPLGFMAPGLFDRVEDIRPAAYAQAETFNAVDGLFPAINIGGVQPLVLLSNVYPWRVWTDWGWQWQPRLTHGTLLRQSAFGPAGVTWTSLAPNAAMH